MIGFENIEFREPSYQKLIKLLTQETKINFDYYHRKFIERRIKARMTRVHCHTVDSYYKYVLSNSDEVKKFIDCFNINYSYFFRNWDVFEQFQNLFLEIMNYKRDLIGGNLRPSTQNIKPPREKKFQKKENSVEKQKNKNAFSSNFDYDAIIKYKLEKKSTISHNTIDLLLSQMSLYKKIKDSRSWNNTLYIWSCPCASGEESYSIAMILDNLRKQIQNFPMYRIVASDIDNEAINKAKIGIYSDDSMKEVSQFFESNYFTKKRENFGYKYSISEEIKKKVEFFEEDVTKSHSKSWKYDVIFCRYLLIYFNKTNRNEFIGIIEKRLNEGGLLILGKTETLFNSYRSFKLIDATNHIYIKSN